MMQRQRLEHYAKEEGIQISGYYEDNGLSGHDLSRPGLKQLMEAYLAGIFEQVLVVSRDRLYRGTRWDEPQWPFQLYSLNELEHSPIR